jgi:2-polyprenyl-3-methyl-5-hydroxy-6-metoxy-1,4-benzoquinol methylase
MSNLVKDYGWRENSGSPCSADYIDSEILSILNKLRIGRVLDVGSGNGSLCGIMSKGGYEVAGVEYDVGGVEVSRLNYPEIPFYNLGVQDSAKAILKEQKLFDAVVSTEVVEHLFSPHHLPIFAKEVLKPGGHLIVTTPYHGYVKNMALSMFNKWDSHHTALWPGGHIKFWSRATLTKLLEANGFKVIQFSGVGRLPYLWKSMVLVAVKLG